MLASRTRTSIATMFLAFAGVLALPRAGDATVIVSLAPSAASIAPGAALDLELRADLSMDAVVGFGLDLVFDSTVLALEAVSIAAPWDPVFAPDGDGLAALAPLAGTPAGSDVLLAIVTLRGLAPGESSVSVATTPGDLTEGFPLTSPPGAFADLVSGSVAVTVAEPGSSVLLLALLMPLGGALRRPKAAALLALAVGLALPGAARSQTPALPAPPCAGGEGIGEGLGAVAEPSQQERPVAISRDGRLILVDLEGGASLVEIVDGSRTLRNIAGLASVVDVSDEGVVVGAFQGAGWIWRWVDLSGFGPTGDLCELIDCDSNPSIDGDTVSVAGISSDGSVVAGRYTFDTGIEGPCTGFICVPPFPTLKRPHPYVWSLVDGFVPLDVTDPLARYDVVGLSADGGTTIGVRRNAPAPSPAALPARWTGTQLEYLYPPAGCTVEIPGAELPCPAEPVDVSADGSVVVGNLTEQAADGQAFTSAVLWKQGRAVRLGPPSTATAISDDGSLVVGETGAGSPFLWDEINGTRPLRDFLGTQGVELEGWTLLSVQDVRTSPLGEIVLVGLGLNPVGDREIWYARLPCLDSDEDRLCDVWERAGGIDVDGDGLILPGADVLLPEADPEYKDLYVEVDAMAGAAVDPAVLERVQLAFNNVPSNQIANPNGSGGIELHLVYDEVGITDLFGSSTSLGTTCDPAFGISELGALIELHRGSPIERENLALLAAKRQVYRYALLAPELDAGGGLATVEGAALASQVRPSADFTAGTFMHELGHTLGLRHGGPGDTTNFKPNYKSVMNYLWQFPASRATNDPPAALKAYASSWRLDYSRVAYATLFEGGLSESAGIGGDPRSFVPTGPPAARLAPEVGPYDFDRDGVIGADPVQANLNWIRGPDPGSSSELLVGVSDWPFVGESLCRIYGEPTFRSDSFQRTCIEGAPAAGPAGLDDSMAEIPEEITPEIAAELASIDYIDCNRNGVVDDVDLAMGVDVDTNDDGVLDGCAPLPGDVDGDGDVDEDDRDRLLLAFGRTEGEPEFEYLADLDRDQWVTFVDYQLWLAAYEDFQASAVAGTTAVEPACGLLGAEALAPLALWALTRRRRRGGPLDA